MDGVVVIMGHSSMCNRYIGVWEYRLMSIKGITYIPYRQTDDIVQNALAQLLNAVIFGYYIMTALVKFNDDIKK